MALFSRRPKKRPPAPEAAPVEPAAPVADVPPAEPHAEDPTPPDVPATMSISVSSYQGLGAQPNATPAPTPAARPATDTASGLRDNVVLRDALAAVSRPATPEELLNVARQLMQGHLFLRVKGDARALLAEGKPVPLGVATVGDKQYVLAYSGGAALRAAVVADADADTTAMGQPVLSVLRYTLDGTYAGLILDNSSAPSRAVLPRELLQKMIDQGGGSLELKSLVAGERTDATASAVVDALARTKPAPPKLWVAVNRSAEGRLGVAESRTTDGQRLIEVYSHPLEVTSMRRSDQPAPMTAAQLAAALRADDGLDGIIVDPAGPWIRLIRADLAPLLALTA